MKKAKAEKTDQEVISHMLDTLQRAYEQLMFTKKVIQKKATTSTPMTLYFKSQQVTALRQRQPAPVFDAIPEYTFNRNSFSPDGKKLIIFDDIPEEDVELFRKGLSFEGTKLSLKGFERGDSPEINSIETFLLNNLHVTHFRWEGAAVTNSELGILRKIPSLKSLELPACGLFTSCRVITRRYNLESL
jgi:hypothetical protein